MVPYGTTHVYPADEFAFNPKPDFFQLEFTHYNSVNEEFLQPMYQLNWWDGKRWVRDTSFSNRLGRMLTRAQYLDLLASKVSLNASS